MYRSNILKFCVWIATFLTLKYLKGDFLDYIDVLQLLGFSGSSKSLQV